jgi:hypothetical protein
MDSPFHGSCLSGCGKSRVWWGLPDAPLTALGVGSSRWHLTAGGVSESVGTTTNRGDEMNDRAERRQWPTGYRLLLWAVGSLLVVTVIVAALFVANAPH